MKSYIQLSRKEIEKMLLLLKGHSVKVSRFGTFPGKSCLFSFTDNGKELFSVWGLYRYNGVFKPADEWETIDYVIKYPNGNMCIFSEYDDNYTLVGKIYASAEKIYEHQQKTSNGLLRTFINKLLRTR